MHESKEATKRQSMHTPGTEIQSHYLERSTIVKDNYLDSVFKARFLCAQRSTLTA